MALSLARPDGKQTALYRFFDAQGSLLYVGIANDPRTRWSSHKGEKRWWGEVATKTLDWFTTREEAERVEESAIVNERPRYNVTHSETRQPGDAKGDNTGRYRHLAKVRILTSDWVLFGQAAKVAGTNRSALLLEFMRWYLRKPGARLPERPLAGAWSNPSESSDDAEARRQPTVRTPSASAPQQLARLAEIHEAADEFRQARAKLEKLVHEAREAGIPLATISKHSGFSREWVRQIAVGRTA